MRVLSIGNSFSQDAQRWLSQCAASVGEYIFATDIYIGGCSLKTHWEKYCSGELAYSCEVNGERFCSITLPGVLERRGKWDVITLQQVSGQSGKIDSYEPYLSDLYRVVREAQPQAKIYIHQTWSYEIDAELDSFLNYDRSQKRMYDELICAYDWASKKLDVPLIRTGEVIQYLREHAPQFDYPNGGLSLNRDGFHLSLLYGRYAAALTWLHTLCGTDVRKVSFVPHEEGKTTDEALLEVVRQYTHEALSR